jgi:DNA-binding NtrC family response regulator
MGESLELLPERSYSVAGPLCEATKEGGSFYHIISTNPRMREIFELIGAVAQTTTTVLIEGATGTGKELVARAIHQASSKRTGAWIAVNCAAVPETLLESELFGHERGSFSGAVGRRRGRFELAHGGTIFLDEVGDVPAAMQAKLLRVLQERSFERIGGTETLNVDVRVIAASNRSLRRMVRKGAFREDLYYRLNVMKIDLPSLHERIEDIPLLAVHFAQKHAVPGQGPKAIAVEAMEILLGHGWPGNIRELENAVERACLTSRDEFIGPDNLPPEITKRTASTAPFSIDLSRTLKEQLSEAVVAFEEYYLRKAFHKAHGNVSRMTTMTGLSRGNIATKIIQYGLKKSQVKAVNAK